MNDKQYVTLDEIKTQPAAWTQAIDVAKKIECEYLELWRKDYDEILFTGCGSSYYLSIAAASTMQSMSGKSCKAFPASELLVSPGSILSKGKKKSILFAISRSGTTTETVRAVERFKELTSGDVIILTNYGDSTLSSLGNISLVIPAGQEKSVAQTRSFSSFVVATCALACYSSNDKSIFSSLYSLSTTGERLMNTYGELAYEIGNDHSIDKYYFLGSGIRYGLASEASLKLKEISLANSEPFYFLEFRHGPISMVDNRTLVIGLLGEESQKVEIGVIDDVSVLGGKTLTIAEKNADISFESGIPELMRGVLYLPVLQLFAYQRAVSNNLNPDKPRNLTSVVTLDF